MINKIVIVGSTGKLGSKLLSFTKKNSIPIFSITCYKNSQKLNQQKNTYSIDNCYTLSNDSDKKKFFKVLKKNIQIIYFLDYGSNSLKYLDFFLKYNSKSIVAIANKEMIIAGGKLLQSKIKQTKNIFIPLDSEHFSLFNSNINKHNIQKIYITASGGPFYFKKNINLQSVSITKVLSHPKWKMGINNLIDSSNFVNKILEIYELSCIYDIPLNNIDFLISKEAYVHSIILFKDNTVSINCFNNNMLITLVKPLTYFYKINAFKSKNKFLDKKNLIIERPNDKRFAVFKFKNKLMKLTHSQQITLMIINNSAHKLYLSNNLNYANILKYIIKEINKNKECKKLKNMTSVLNYISNKNKYYKTNV